MYNFKIKKVIHDIKNVYQMCIHSNDCQATSLINKPSFQCCDVESDICYVCTLRIQKKFKVGVMVMKKRLAYSISSRFKSYIIFENRLLKLCIYEVSKINSKAIISKFRLLNKSAKMDLNIIIMSPNYIDILIK